MPQTDRTGGGDLILSSRYTRVTSSQDIVPVPTACQRIATNQSGSLSFLTMNEIPAVKDVDVWEGADSASTGIHQKYVYEAKTEIPMPTIEGSDSLGFMNDLLVFGAFYGTLTNDLLMGFLTALDDTTNPLFFWDISGNALLGVLAEEIIDAGQDISRMVSIVTPGPATGGFQDTVAYNPSLGATLHIGQSIHIRGGLLGVTASSEGAGSSPSLSITPSEPSSIVVACLSYQGTLPGTTLPAFSDMTGWTVLQTQTVPDGAGLFALQAIYWRQVPNIQLVTLNPTVNEHDGVNTTSMFLAAISGTGSIESIWSQFLLLKDVVGTFTPGEVLALQ